MKTVAQSGGILFGTSIANGGVHDPEVQRLVKEECTILTSNVQLKWDALRPTPDSFSFGPADDFVAFCTQNDIVAHGHTLVWYQALPKWFDQAVNASNAKVMLAKHISTVVGRYRGKIRYWDVVNEVVRPTPADPNALRQSAWFKLMGPGYIEEAFHLARAADPNAILVWNEDDCESDNDYSRQKRQTVLQVLSRLQKSGAPIQAFGLQAHLKQAFKKTNPDYLNFLRALKDSGIKLLISEMDVIDTDIPAEHHDEEVGSIYYDFITGTGKVLKPVAIQVWELSDAHNWMDTSMPQWKRADGMNHRPAVLDSSGKIKPAWTQLQQAMREIS